MRITAPSCCVTSKLFDRRGCHIKDGDLVALIWLKKVFFLNQIWVWHEFEPKKSWYHLWIYEHHVPHWKWQFGTHPQLLFTFGQYIKPGYVDDFSYNLQSGSFDCSLPLRISVRHSKWAPFVFARCSVWRCEKRMGLNWDSMWKHWIARRPELMEMGPWKGHGEPKWILVKSSR